MRGWDSRRWLIAAAGAVLTALAIGIPTGIVKTSFYTRMTPVLWWNYPVWAITSALSGLLLATYVAARGSAPAQQKKAMAGGLLSVFAVGCPVCNKLVVLALGASGAMTYFAPLQPILAVASLALLGEAFRRRLRAERTCAVPSTTVSLPGTPASLPSATGIGAAGGRRDAASSEDRATTAGGPGPQ